eukprot:s789_g2.t1
MNVAPHMLCQSLTTGRFACAASRSQVLPWKPRPLKPRLGSNREDAAGRVRSEYHLLWSPGFVWRTFVVFAFFLTLHMVPHCPSMHWPQYASRCWDVLGPLMASACCALQLVMNLLNAGCGKFNKILGPWRPFFLGCLMVTSLHSSPLKRCTQLFLAFLPELLHLSTRRAQRRFRRFNGVTLELRVPGMGCVACINKVTATLQALPEILHCNAWLEEEGGRARVRFRTGHASIATNQRLVRSLQSAGFQAEIGQTKTQNWRAVSSPTFLMAPESPNIQDGRLASSIEVMPKGHGLPGNGNPAPREETNVRVVARFRPPITEEEEKDQPAFAVHAGDNSNAIDLGVAENATVQSHDGKWSFDFDTAFSEEASQEVIYHRIGLPAVQDVLTAFGSRALCLISEVWQSRYFFREAMVIQLRVSESWKPDVEAVDEAPGFPGDSQFDVKVLCGLRLQLLSQEISTKPELVLSDDIPSFDDGSNKKGQSEEEGVFHTVGFEARQKRRKTRQELVHTFLQFYGFPDLETPKRVARASGEEEVYPLHMAAELGDAAVLGALLLARADPDQRTSWDRTAFELAVLNNRDRSHFEAIECLRSRDKWSGQMSWTIPKLSVHEFKKMPGMDAEGISAQRVHRAERAQRISTQRISVAIGPLHSRATMETATGLRIGSVLVGGHGEISWPAPAWCNLTACYGKNQAY